MILNKLPYPPSVNSCYRAIIRGKHATVIISKKGREYRKEMAVMVAVANVTSGGKLTQDYLPDGPMFIEPIELRIELYPPDRRKRDIDNPLKPLIDSMMKAGLFKDDSQIKRLHVAMHEPVKGGRVDVEIKEISK